MRFYLMSCHGGLLARGADQPGVVQVPIAQSGDRQDLVVVDLDPDIFRQPFIDVIEQKAPVPFEADLRFIGTCQIHAFAASRTIAMSREGAFAGMPPEGAVEFNRTEVKAWEHFLPVSEGDLDVLQLLLAERWIVKSSRVLVEPQSITFGENFNARIGGLDVPLNFNLPLDQTHTPFRFTVLANGWKIDEILLFKPLIYYLAPAEESVFQQLSLSLVSLGMVAKYRGKVWIYSNREPAEIRRAMPWLPASQLTVKSLSASDWVGTIAGKYDILEDEDADMFQPVVYMDPDVVYNADIQPMLIAMALSDRMTAPLQASCFAKPVSADGATLLRHQHELPGIASGFNCGIIGIPNLPGQRQHLKLIRRVICNIVSQYGGITLDWVDQEAANYVSHKIAHVETHDVSRYVRYAEATSAAVPTDPLTGVVHFRGADRQERPQIMRAYLDRVLRRYAVLREEGDKPS